MLKRLIEISRPLLWVNTIGTTVLGMWLGGDLWRWDIVALLLFATLPFNLLIYGVNDVYDQDTDALNPRKGGVEGALIKPSEAKMIMIGTAVLNIPFLIYFFYNDFRIRIEEDFLEVKFKDAYFNYKYNKVP